MTVDGWRHFGRVDGRCRFKGIAVPDAPSSSADDEEFDSLLDNTQRFWSSAAS